MNCGRRISCDLVVKRQLLGLGRNIHNGSGQTFCHLRHLWRQCNSQKPRCFGTSKVYFNTDDNENKSVDTKETEFFDRFYEAVKEGIQSENYAIQQIRKAKLSEADKKRAIQRWTFEQVVDIYIKQNLNRRRHVEFIYEALDRIIDLGLQRDINAYKKLLTAFPQDGSMMATSPWLVEMKFHPKQQDCAIDLMDQMEENGLIPDDEFCTQIEELFGGRSHAYRKIRRMLYWGRKFNNANPYQLPFLLPDDPIELAVLALRKMVIDLQNEIKIWQSKEPEDTFIVSAQSCNQRALVSKHDCDKPMYVEGGFSVWLRDTSLTYFVLRSDTDQSLFPDPVLDEEDEGLFHFETVFDTENPKEIMPRPSEHQQEDGTILAMCITGTSSKDSLIQWIRNLQEANPILEQTSIVFRLKSPVDDDEVLTIEHKGGELEPV